MDDPILVELEEDDYWYRGYNMRTGERGIFPAFYAHEVIGQARDVTGTERSQLCCTRGPTSHGRPSTPRGLPQPTGSYGEPGGSCD